MTGGDDEEDGEARRKRTLKIRFDSAVGILGLILAVTTALADNKAQRVLCVVLIGWLLAAWLIVMFLSWSRGVMTAIVATTIVACLVGYFVIVRDQAVERDTRPGLTLWFDARSTEGSDRMWRPRLTVAPGEEVELLVAVQNVGGAVNEDIVTRVVPPPYLGLVPGSVEFITADHRTTQNDAPLFDGGIDAGDFGPGGGLYFLYRSTVESTGRCSTVVRALAYAKSDQTPYEREAPVDIEIIDQELCG